MGTTLTALLIDDQVGLLGHVGDSRAYRLRDGVLELLTHDHSWVADRVRQGLLSEEEARRHRWRNVITNALGANPPSASTSRPSTCVPATASFCARTASR